MPRLSKIGAAALAAFGWTGGASVSASYLVVAGGGGAGCHGGGGAGGFLTGTTSLNPTQSFTVTVGAGGAGVVSGPSGGGINGSNGSNSQFGTLTASVGGGGGGGYAAPVAGSAGGSGGGGGYSDPIGGALGGAGTSGQGNAGGSGFIGGAGGGGANAVGSNGGGSGSAGVGGAGGNGTASSISGSSVTYAGGGGGGNGDARTGGSGGAGGTGGGGAGSTGTLTTGAAGTANLGGGGGGGGSGTGTNYGGGGKGGSGVVIISYVGAQQFGGGVVTVSGGSTIHTFTTSGTLSPLSSLTASYLIVAGGGGGGAYAYPGGGGAGGFLSGSGLILDTNSIYIVSVGGGGVKGDVSGDTNGGNGVNSSFSGFATTAVGGGGGSQSTTSGGSGGSGGGGKGSTSGNVGGTATSGQGNNGGTGGSDGATWANGGGGGGAGAVGGTATSGAGGNGGAGLTSSISGTSTYYAGGGGGGGTGTEGTGGLGGGGAANESGGTAGTANTGGGGGSAGGVSVTSGGAGGSGIVIISYAGSTQQMAGGTVTVSGGNVIHTFTSSGYLTPIVLTTNSLRFRSSASAYLNRTPASAGNRRTFTYSVWLKRGVLDASYNKYFFSAKPSPSVRDGMYFGTSQTLSVFANDGSSASLVTTQVFRDVSAWYHIVVAVDTTQATASDRVKIYVNGSQVTAFGTATYPAINYDWAFNNSVIHTISDDAANAPTGLYHFDGYMTEINFIDGQALTPFSFGTTSDLGVWQPIRYGGSYGTNGFYLKFTDTTNTTTLGYDSSPNSNNWTTNNISLTAGSTYDSMTDVPTLTSATAGNYCVMNPLDNGGVTLSNGNLTITGAGSVFKIARSTLGVSTGKWYCEFVITAEGAPSRIDFGLLGFPATLSGSLGDTSNGYTVYESSSNIYKYNNSTSTLLVSSGSLDVNDVQMLAYDADAGKLWFGKNGTWFASGDPVAGTNAAFTGVSGQTYFVAVQAYNTSDVGQINFGQRPFTYTPPTGFVRLNTFNLPTPTIGATAATLANEYFDASLWTGNGSTQTITNSGSMQPDFVWYKGRSTTFNHGLFDSIRGTLQRLSSNLTSAESTTAGSLTAFNSNGFSVGSDAGANQNTDTYVAWQWRASNATAVTNTNGTITSTVSASTTAGFSIVTYTGTGVNATVGHGLGATPSMVTVKCRSTAGESWHTYHVGLSSLANTVYLNGTAAQGSFPTCFNSMSTLNSTVFSLGTDGASNGSGRTYVAYCFAPIAGYSAFGSYTGNGSADGPFVFTGFRPRFVMFKRTDSSDDWVFLDIARNTYNVMISALFPNSSSSETSNGFYDSDCVSNGFKIRATNAVVNASSGTYIYMAFAESPFKYANAR